MRTATIDWRTNQIKVENNGEIELIAPIDEELTVLIYKNEQLYDEIIEKSEGEQQ